MKRILSALLIALVGIALSWQFLRPKEWTTSSLKNRQVVARVLGLHNDAGRQEEGRLLWSSLRTGDEVYLGDKVKTGGLSSIVLQFSDSTSKLEIEENTVIVMSRGEKKLALNMLEGRVFFQQEDDKEGTPELISGGKKLDVIGNAAISVNKDGVGQVENQAGPFSELKPEYSQDILSVKNDLELFWKPLDQSEVVELYVGESPLLLKKVEGLKSSLKAGKILAPFKPGINYWQLVAITGEKEARSGLMKLNLINPIPPTPLYPSDKELIKTTEGIYDFKWMKGNAGDSVVLEVSKDSTFKETILSDVIKDQTFFSPTLNLIPGNYFWRVKVKLQNSEWLISKTNAFTVYLGSNFISPMPLTPTEDAIFYLGNSPSNNVKFQWRKQDEAVQYDLKIHGDNFERETQVADSGATVNLNRVGKYLWEVFSINKDGKKSVLPVKRQFEVRKAEVIQWKMAEKNFLYLDSLPIIILKWEKKFSGPSILNVSGAPDFKGAESYQMQGKDFPYRVQKDGIYFAKVTGLDENGEIAGESEIFEFKVEAAPLPLAPKFAENIIKATPQGLLRTRVENFQSSWQLVASLTDAQGRVIDERRFTEETISFSGLMPGKYTLQAKFQDDYRRSGEVSDRVEVEVPQKSLIAAPKVKGIKVR